MSEVRHCIHCEQPVFWVPSLFKDMPDSGFWIHVKERKRACSLVATPHKMIDGIEHINCQCKECVHQDRGKT